MSSPNLVISISFWIVLLAGFNLCLWVFTNGGFLPIIVYISAIGLFLGVLLHYGEYFADDPERRPW